MRIARFAAGGEARYGVVANTGTDTARGNGNGAGAQAEGPEIAELAGHPLGAMQSIRFTGTRYPMADVRLLAPIVPGKVVAIGRNYAAHAREMGHEVPAEPVIFLKPSTSVIGPGDPIIRPVRLSERVDFEGELAVVIGKIARNLPPEQA